MRLRQSGISLVSFLVASAIFGLLFAFSTRSFYQSSDVWRRMNSTTEASVGLRRASSMMQRDLLGGSARRVRVAPGPSTLSGSDGDLIWFLSALDDSGNFVRKADGSPFWQKTILYYTITPLSSEVSTIGSGGSDSLGYEDRCPYKLLIRKEIDFGVPTDITDETTSELLMSNTDALSYCTRPNDHDLTPMASESGVLALQLVARDLLTTRYSLASGQVRVQIFASANDQGRKVAGFGTMSLASQPFIHEINSTVVPRIDEL